jgi:hypothetical protein
MPKSRANGFALTKWYMDCVDPTGRAVIAYWASLSWHKVALTWHNIAVYEPGHPPHERTSLVPVPAPEYRDGAVTWRTRALDASVESRTRYAKACARLLDEPYGVIDWCCDAPASVTRVEVAGHAPIHGTGYAEHLVLTALPWRLPIDELRWGRWISSDADRSVVWTDFRGPSPRTWVFVDGVERPGATVGDREVVAGGAALALNGTRTLHARALRDVVRSIPVLLELFPESLLALSEHKSLSTGTYHEGDMTPLSGSAIHEVVRFR